MNCKKCGEKLAVFSHYCENCGAEGLSTLGWCQYIGIATLAFLKKRPWIAIAVACIFILSVGLGIWRNAANTIDPSEFVITQVSGFNGDGRIQVSVDYDSLFDEILGPVPDVQTAKDYEKYSRYIERVEALSSALWITADRTEGLQNGDFYIITVDILDKEAFTQCGVKIKKDVYHKTLQIGRDCASFDEPVELDLFELITLSFCGNNGNGYVVVSDEPREKQISFHSGNKLIMKVECYESWRNYSCHITFLGSAESIGFKFYASKRKGLVNGETIKITLDENAIVGLREFGILVKNTEQNYTVSGLTETVEE